MVTKEFRCSKQVFVHSMRPSRHLHVSHSFVENSVLCLIDQDEKKWLRRVRNKRKVLSTSQKQLCLRRSKPRHIYRFVSGFDNLDSNSNSTTSTLDLCYTVHIYIGLVYTTVLIQYTCNFYNRFAMIRYSAKNKPRKKRDVYFGILDQIKNNNNVDWVTNNQNPFLVVSSLDFVVFFG
jgi:hypothetical protein